MTESGPFLMMHLFALHARHTMKGETKLDRRDPRFVGAWWLGFMIIGTLIFLSSLPLFLFPKSLREKTKQKAITPSTLSKYQGML